MRGDPPRLIWPRRSVQAFGYAPQNHCSTAVTECFVLANQLLETNLTVNPAPRLPAPRLPVADAPAGIRCCSPNSTGRTALEAFIQDGFQRQHGAAVHSFMPVLIGMFDAAGNVIGAAGYRPAARDPLYLEQYLGEPIEAVVARRFPALTVTRTDIAEIGNFACRDCATAMRMVEVLADLLHERGHCWTVFTATRTVRGILRHLGISLTELGWADKSRVVVTGDDWGRYYQTDPRVMLGYVPSWRGACSRARSA